MKYTILKTAAPGIFTLEDENGHPIADVRGEANANLFAAVQEMLELLDECTDSELVFPHFEITELLEKIKPFRT